mmetsp:Transcript_24521/g.71775  ORF Transcript_24521/g.71775 Transcript_24521/m.71775 type:complete len:121 (-) Transcript_24521:315-677(-)
MRLRTAPMDAGRNINVPAAAPMTCCLNSRGAPDVATRWMMPKAVHDPTTVATLIVPMAFGFFGTGGDGAGVVDSSSSEAAFNVHFNREQRTGVLNESKRPAKPLHFGGGAVVVRNHDGGQ